MGNKRGHMNDDWGANGAMDKVKTKWNKQINKKIETKPVLEH